MKYSISINKKSMFIMCLFLLSLLENLKKIYILSLNSGFLNLENKIKYPIYAILLLSILYQKYYVREFLIGLVIGTLLFVGYLKSHMSGFLEAFLLLLASKDVEINKIFKTIRYSIFISIILALILYALGISNAGVARRGYSSFGFSHPNQAAQMYMLFILLWIAEHYKYQLGKMNLIIALSCIGIVLLTGSRTVLVTMVSFIVLLPLMKKYFEKFSSKNLGIKLIEGIHPLFTLFTYIAAKNLGNSLLLQKLDVITVNRLFLNYYALIRFGVYWFGQDTDLKTYGNVYNNIRNVYWTTGTTVDSAYMTSILAMGIIPTIIWTIGYMAMMIRVAKIRNYVFFTLAIVLCLESFMETGMLEIYNNFVLFFLFAKLIPENKEVATNEKNS